MNCLREKEVKTETYLVYNYSEDKPLADNANIEGHRKNRYTILAFHKKLTIPEKRFSISANLLDDQTKEAIADSLTLVFYGEESDSVRTDKNGNLSFTVPDSVKTIDFLLKTISSALLMLIKKQAKI
jgi:hypothetical protein